MSYLKTLHRCTLLPPASTQIISKDLESIRNIFKDVMEGTQRVCFLILPAQTTHSHNATRDAEFDRQRQRVEKRDPSAFFLFFFLFFQLDRVPC